uniref:Tl_7 protein n=1 Tax=Fopius arisanus TaxID=64838 RepID=A0A0C9RW22_9HYME
MYRLQWCVMVGLLSQVMSFQCPKGPGCGSCQELPDNTYQVHCETSDLNSAFTVHFKPEEWVRIECYNSPNWTEFHLGKIQQILQVNSISFRKCKLPEREKLGAIANQIVADNIEDLIFQSIGDLTLSLSRNTFANFKNVKRLTLSSNGLKNVTEDLLHDMKNLTLLNLRENNLHELPHDFLDLPHLKSIELGGNHLEVIAPPAFDKLPKLTLLNIWKNEIIEVKPKSFDKLENLVNLDLHLNRLETLPEDLFSKLGKLQFINLSQNNFTGESLPENLFRNNTGLDTVSLSENKRNLTTLPSKFLANLNKLKVVKLRRSGLIQLPEDLFVGATALTDLNLERNYIEHIPQKIFRDCKNLSSINLSVNEIRELPEGLFLALKRLELLDLSRNYIESISEDVLEGLTSLRVLNLEHNGLRTIHPRGFNSLENLRIARLGSNELTLKTDTTRYDDEFGPKSPFHNCMGTIEEIHLAYNNVSDIFGDWIFAKRLRTLDLSHNQITFLQEDDFQFVSDDIEVDLSSNRIERVILKTVEMFSKKATYVKNIMISIEKNPIVCDCNIHDLLRYREGRMDPTVDSQFTLKMNELMCHKPKSLENVLLKDLESKSLKCLVEEPVMYDAQCPDRCSCWMRPEDQAYLVDCSWRNLRSAPASLKSPPRFHVELNLTGNYLTSFPSMHQPGYSAVTVLSLSHNQIAELPVSALSDNLSVLELDGNALRRLETPVLEFLANSSSLRYLSLQENPWVSDCDARDFLSFVQTKVVTIPELQRITFHLSDVPVFEMTPEELCPPVVGWVIGLCIGIAVLGVIVGALAAVYYRYQREIKVWLYARQWCLWLVSEDELDKDKLYDAFVSYSHKDEEFVVNNLIRTLEGGTEPFKLCVHYRDWKAGDWIPEQIARSVDESRRTIVVLSPNFLESVWGKMEFRTAHTQALSEGRARVIVVLYGDVGSIDQLEPELKAYLSMNTYVKWGDPWFWDKLRYALPHHDDLRREKAKASVFQGQQPVFQIVTEKGGIGV